MKRLLPILLCSLLLSGLRNATAQEASKTWTLQECLDYAYQNNIQVRQSRNNQLRASRIPNRRKPPSFRRWWHRHAKLHELPFVRSHGQQQLYGDLRHNGGNDDLRRWQAPYGSQEAESPESNGRSLGRGIRERHPHRHRTGLHAVPLRRRCRANQPQHGRSLEGPARTGPRRCCVPARSAA